MLVFLGILFLLFYWKLPNKDKVIFQNAGWLYFYSHLQFFVLGVVLMFFGLSFLVYCFFMFCFLFGFFYVLFFICSLFLCVLGAEYVYYGIFSSSFLIESVNYKNKYMNKILVICNFLIKVFTFNLSLLFFVSAYFLLCFFWGFFIWTLLFECFDVFLVALLSTYCVHIYIGYIFLFPFMIEAFYYSVFHESYFFQYK